MGSGSLRHCCKNFAGVILHTCGMNVEIVRILSMPLSRFRGFFPSCVATIALALHGTACGASRPSPAEATPVPAADSTARSRAPGGSVRPLYVALDSGNHAIAIFAAARISELRFDKDPRVSVRLLGALGDSVRVLERRNLPDRIVPGTTYRDVYVAVEILGHVNAECLSALITGAAPRDSLSARTCAALTARDSARAPVRRP